MTDWNKQTVSGLIYWNDAGALYQPGRMYQLPRKTEVAEVYLRLCKELAHPSVMETAKLSKVSWAYANLVVTELKAIGMTVDPELLQRKKLNVLGPGQTLTTVHEMFILALRTVDPARLVYSYVQELITHFGKSVSYQCISDWFRKRWDFDGNLKKANLVLLDKWKLENKVRYYEFVQKLRIFKDHSRFNFLDEKHVWNRDVYAKKVQKDPLTGKLPCIHVSGDFRKSYNIMAIISSNLQKPHRSTIQLAKKTVRQKPSWAF
jgi:hypothetical protein